MRSGGGGSNVENTGGKKMLPRDLVYLYIRARKRVPAADANVNEMEIPSTVR